ncbi:MAG: hypothetical protein K1X48_11560 [Burkholderiaceae bacterium]|nr:hypothetical protein [Burkholderiaceae bacterium]
MKNFFMCFFSFVLATCLTAGTLLFLAQRASIVWAVDTALQMSLRFEQTAKLAFSRNDKEQAQKFMTAAFLVRRDLAEEKNLQRWPITMPTVGFSFPAIGIPDFVKFTRDSMASKETLLLYKCAALALSDGATQTREFQEIQKEFPKITLEHCKNMGVAFFLPEPTRDK